MRELIQTEQRSVQVSDSADFRDLGQLLGAPPGQSFLVALVLNARKALFDNQKRGEYFRKMFVRIFDIYSRNDVTDQKMMFAVAEILWDEGLEFQSIPYLLSYLSAVSKYSPEATMSALATELYIKRDLEKIYSHASILEQQNGLEAARDLFTALESFPHCRDGCYFHLGCIYTRMKMVDQASKYLRLCIARMPNHRKAADMLASIETEKP